MASNGRNISRLFIGNLPWTIGSQELKQYFQEFGKVLTANVVFDKKTGCSKGYGFVTVNSNKYMENLEQKSVHNLEGNVLNIQQNN